MEQGGLKSYFKGVAFKRLASVETLKGKSNQHEFNGKQELKKLLGAPDGKKRFSATYIYIEESSQSFSSEAFATMYESRKKTIGRTEHRLYYPTNEVTSAMDVGDALFIALRPENHLLLIITPFESDMMFQLAWLFGIGVEVASDLEFNNLENSIEVVDFAARLILDEIGIEYSDPNANSLDTIIDRFGLSFPTTKEFSDLARLTLPEVDARDDPDFALMAWLDHEEAMFRRLEKRIVSKRLLEGFIEDEEADVDAFIKFSLSVQNRRKSRMGHSLENHISAALEANKISYVSQFKTMKGKKPDYVFPSAESYLDESYPVQLLTMLAAKSSCKERWSQVLSEAERIPEKHLLTLDPGIPNATTQIMRGANLQLVVPTDRHKAYTKTQRKWLISFGDFIELVKARQEGYAGPAQGKLI